MALEFGVMCLCYSHHHHHTSGWLIKTKIVAWNLTCLEIFCFNLHGVKLLHFSIREFDCKVWVWCEISFHNLVSRLLLLFLSWARVLVIRNKKYVISNCKWYLKPESQICRICTADVRLCPTYKMASRNPKRCMHGNRTLYLPFTIDSE